jgi:hypothetical protein
MRFEAEIGQSSATKARKNRVRNLYGCFLISAILAAHSTAVAQSVPQGTSKTSSGAPATSITISAFHDSVNAGSRVDVIVTLTNTSNHDIWLVRLRSGADSKIDVRDANGKLAPDTSFGYLRNGHVAQSALDETRFSTNDLTDNGVGEMVKAGQTTKWSMNAGKFYDMSHPGMYRIRIEREDPEDPKIIVKSNTVTVTVTP